MVENSVAMIEEREKEITAIVQSISEINEMYRDLATMVVDQVGYTYLYNYCICHSTQTILNFSCYHHARVQYWIALTTTLSRQPTRSPRE